MVGFRMISKMTKTGQVYSAFLINANFSTWFLETVLKQFNEPLQLRWVST